MIDHAGQQLGNYRLLNLLGKGGFAHVYLAEHVYLGTQAAIKILQMQVGDAERQAFLNEARTIAHLVHPHIVRILDFGVQENTPYLVMDYAPHGMVGQYYPKGTALPLEMVSSYVKQIASALQYAHNKHMIHRDVKPGNILLGQTGAALLSDFGIALISQNSSSQRTDESIIGTIAYMAPEQIMGKPRPASDQYSLGIVAYEWLCGDRPFHGTTVELVGQQMTAQPPSLHERVPTISSAINEAVMIALAKDPKERFGTVQAFANALGQAIDAEQQQGHQAQPAPTILSYPKLAPTQPASPAPMPAQGAQPAYIAPYKLPPVQVQQSIMQTEPEIPVKSTSKPQINVPSSIHSIARSNRINVTRGLFQALIGACILGALIVLSRHMQLLPVINLGMGITTYFFLSVLTDILLPFFGAITGAWGGLFVAIIGCLLGNYGDTLLGYPAGGHGPWWYILSAIVGILAGLAARRTFGQYKIVRAVTMTLVTLLGSISVGFGIPLSPPFGELAVLLTLIFLPLLLQTYKSTTNYK